MQTEAEIIVTHIQAKENEDGQQPGDKRGLESFSEFLENTNSDETEFGPLASRMLTEQICVALNHQVDDILL